MSHRLKGLTSSLLEINLLLTISSNSKILSKLFSLDLLFKKDLIKSN